MPSGRSSAQRRTCSDGWDSDAERVRMGRAGRGDGGLPPRRQLVRRPVRPAGRAARGPLPRDRARPARARPFAVAAALGRRRPPRRDPGNRPRRAGDLDRAQLRRAARCRARRPRPRPGRADRPARPRAAASSRTSHSTWPSSSAPTSPTRPSRRPCRCATTTVGCSSRPAELRDRVRPRPHGARSRRPPPLPLLQERGDRRLERHGERAAGAGRGADAVRAGRRLVAHGARRASSIYRAALGDLVEVVTVPGGHTVYWDALAETREAIEAFWPELAAPRWPFP